jgi:hypothetical protein
LSARDVALAVVCAALWVASISFITEPVGNPIQYDGRSYVRMAEHSFLGYEKIPAPFAYRPAVPALVYVVSQLISFDVPATYRVVAHAAAFLTLVLVYLMACNVGARHRTGLIVMAVAALSHFQVRGPLFFYSLIDVEALSVVMLAMLLLWQGHRAASLAVAAVGLLAKEWLLIPALVAGAELLRDATRNRGDRGDRSDRDMRAWIALALGAFAVAAAIAWPRLVATPSQSFSSLDRIDSVASLFATIGKPQRLANAAFVCASYGLPVWMLLTRERLGPLRESLSRRGPGAALYCGLVLAFALLGGTNLMIFVSYSLPVLVIVLASLLQGARAWEIAFVIAALFAFNNLWAPIPELSQKTPSLHAWADFYGGWGTRITAATGYRALEIVAFIAAANAGRMIWRQPAAQ